MDDLIKALTGLAEAPVLLVASDYDGTIAPITTDPEQARPLREAVVALRNLAALAETHVAIISGRALRDLAELSGVPEDVHLVGSHGSEFDPNFSRTLPDELTQLRDRVFEELSEIASRGNGFLLERKPASVAFHYRTAPDDAAASAMEAILDGPATIEGVFTKHGKKVVELAVLSTNKGSALERIRHRVGASAVVFFGDDCTDEDAFATLKGPDIGVKVGDGESRAAFRVRDPVEVTQVLARLCELRQDWHVGAAAVPIEKHSMLSDQRTVALVTPDARVTWFCTPRIDSSALFADLLGGPTAGHFTIACAKGAAPIEQAYLGKSFALETRWPGFSVVDFLDCSGGRPGQRAGRCDLVRILQGEGRAVIEFSPRLDFGRVETRMFSRDGGLEVEGTLDPIVLRSPGVEWQIFEEGHHHCARAEVQLSAEPIVIELRYGTGSLRERSTPAQERLRQTERFWTNWADQLVLPSEKTHLVLRSALVLKGLCYGPTGAISAAATTSLPEHVGGVRNWDYRYCWLRDSAMSAAALVRLGSEQEAIELLDWVLGVLDETTSPERLHPLYSVTGHELGPEADIGELRGYRGSRPVRVGNYAARQVQLDVFGPVVELVALLLERDSSLSSEHWRLVEAMVRAVERRWTEPDHGIWELRSRRRHHVHSRVCCWLTIDRAITIGHRFFDRERREWIALRDAIAADVLEHGYKPDVQAFTAAYDDTDLDAAAMHVGLSGLLPFDDERVINTVAAVERNLRKGPTVYRYRSDDGLPGAEGGFNLCTSWLISCYARMGRLAEARELFNEMINLAGPTGMMSEEYGPNTKRSLGNVPQAYSHLGLIENAILLSQMRE